MRSKQEVIDLLSLEEERLKTLQTLLSNIDQSRDIEVGNTIQVYAPLPKHSYSITDLEKRESSIFTAQAKFIKKILQHPQCPENLNFEITLTDNHSTYAHGNNRTRTPLAPIFEALTSGKCIARGLKIKLEGEANHVLSSEMNILVKGLADGKCPNNLQISFGTLEIFVNDPLACQRTNAWNLMEALKSANCPSGLNIEYTAHNKVGWISNESNERYIELARLCTNGNYDRENIKRNIDKIHAVIKNKLCEEISRLDGREESVRTDALKLLRDEIDTICNSAKTHIETCDASTTWEWKNSLRDNLKATIDTSLESSKFDKKYTSYEKFGKKLLNIVTGLIFPLALIKYAITGNAFFSTVGKSQEVVVDTLNISKSIK